MSESERCCHCGTTKLGLASLRHYFALFCSLACKDAYLETLAVERERIKKWEHWLEGR
jgi:hypothetical protein